MSKYPDTWLWKYVKECEAGKIIVGKEIKQEFARLKEKYNDPAISWDAKESDKRIKFIEKECRHYEAPFAGKPFILTLRQKAFIEAFYNFKIFDEEDKKTVRLHQRYLLLIARKCGKTPLVAAMDLAEFFCGEVGTRVLCSSNDYEQAALMFDAINAMREESRVIERVTRKNIKGIFFGNQKQKKKTGKFSSQNKGWIKKISAKTSSKEGKNIKVGSVDEAHELKDDKSVKPIRQSLSSQDEPIYGEITTEGFVEDGYLDETLAEARKVLKGELDRPEWLIFLYTQDSEEEIYQDEKSWVKSNPDLGTIKKKKYLRQMVEESKTNNSTRAFVLAKDFNIKQGSSVAWMKPSDILNKKTFELAEFKDAYYIVGNDFAETTDLCASVLLFKKPGDKTNYLYSRYFIPENKLKESPDDVDYKEWEKEGLLEIAQGNTVDTSIVADWQFALFEEYDLKPFRSGYDNRFAKDYINRFTYLFGEGLLINIPQNFICLSDPMNTLEMDLRDKSVNYNNNPIDYWCFKNTGFRVDKIGRIMPSKMEKTKRIDGTAAALCAYAAYQWNRSEYMALIGV